MVYALPSFSASTSLHLNWNHWSNSPLDSKPQGTGSVTHYTSVWKTLWWNMHLVLHNLDGGHPNSTRSRQATVSEMSDVLNLEDSEGGNQTPEKERAFRKKEQYVGNTPQSMEEVVRFCSRIEWTWGEKVAMDRFGPLNFISATWRGQWRINSREKAWTYLHFRIIILQQCRKCIITVN